jgi:hypothetical protein
VKLCLALLHPQFHLSVVVAILPLSALLLLDMDMISHHHRRLVMVQHTLWQRSHILEAVPSSMAESDTALVVIDADRAVTGSVAVVKHKKLELWTYNPLSLTVR